MLRSQSTIVQTQEAVLSSQLAVQGQPLSWVQFQEKFKFPVITSFQAYTEVEAAAVQFDVDLAAIVAERHLTSRFSLAAHAIGAVSRHAIAVTLTFGQYIVALTTRQAAQDRPEARKNRAAELSRDYNIREEALVDFLNRSPVTLEACLQIGKKSVVAILMGCIVEPRLRLLKSGKFEDFEKAIATNKEIIITKSNNEFSFHYRNTSKEFINVFTSNDAQLEALLAPFPFNGQLLPPNQRTEALYRCVYQKVTSNNGVQFEYRDRGEHGESIEEMLTRYLKTRVLLGLDPKEIIQRRELCIQSADKYPNEEALAYINTLEAEESRKRTLSACQPALGSLEDSSVSPMLFSGGCKRLLPNNVKTFSEIVCDYLHGPSTLEAEYVPLYSGPHSQDNFSPNLR